MSAIPASPRRLLPDRDLDAFRAGQDAGFGPARNLPLDSHLHTDLSPDSDVPIDVFGARAVEQGIPEIAITDHVDFDPRGPAYGRPTYDERERTVREAAERWADRGVTIRFGVEITYERRYEAEIRSYLARHRHDFVIGSVHIGPDSPYLPASVAGWVAGRPLGEIVGPYFDEVEGAARSGLFDTVGHLDFVKRYLHPLVTPAHLAAAPELYERLLRALVDTGTGLEINTSGLRQAPLETYPSEAVAARFKVLGGTGVSAGSDAHRAESFAFGLDEGYRVAAGAGFATLLFRRGADRVAVTIPDEPAAERQPNRRAAQSL